MSPSLLVLWLSLGGAPPLDSLGCTPLQLAVRSREAGAVLRLAGRRLLGAVPPEADLEQRGAGAGLCSKRTPLMLAAEQGDARLVELLLAGGASLRATASDAALGEDPVDARCLALIYSRDEAVAALDHAGAQQEACIVNALLFQAILRGAPESIARQMRAHPSAQSLLAALAFASANGREEAVEHLLAGAMREEDLLSAAYGAAIRADQVASVAALANHVPLRGGDELALAITRGRWRLIPYLMAAGARPHAGVHQAVLGALQSQDEDTVTALLEAGYRGDSDFPLLLHAVRHFPALVPRMVAAGVEVEIDDEAGLTPLMAAAARNDEPSVKLLLERGASPRTADLLCDTARDTAGARVRGLLPASGQPVPGRAARRLGLTCGPARLSISVEAGFEAYLPGAVDPMRPEMEHRLDPGPVSLRVREVATGRERTVSRTLAAGPNSWQVGPTAAGDEH